MRDAVTGFLSTSHPCRPYTILTVEAKRGKMRRIEVKGDSATSEAVLREAAWEESAEQRPVNGAKPD